MKNFFLGGKTFMRKLSLLIALMLCVTVGGVYATWMYSGNTDIVDREAEAMIALAGADFDGAAGNFAISSNLKLTIDDTNNDKDAELIFASTDGQPIHLTITFTPSANADDDVKEKGISAEFYTKFNAQPYKIDADGNYSAEGTATPILNIFNPSDGSVNFNILPMGSTTAANQWTWNDEGGYFEVTFDEAALRDMISLTQAFRLDAKSEYDQFHACLEGSVITLCVTDGVVNSGNVG